MLTLGFELITFAIICSHYDLNPQLFCQKMLTLGFEPTTKNYFISLTYFLQIRVR